MARPYSLDLRARAVEAVQSGLPRRAAARRFAVSESFVIKLQRVAATGSAAPSPMGGRKSYALAAHAAVVQELIETRPTLRSTSCGRSWRPAGLRSAAPRSPAFSLI